MPFLFNNKVAVTKEDLIPSFYRTESTLLSEIQRYKEKPYGIKRLMLGGHGRQLLVDLDTLRQEIRQAIADPRKPEHVMEPFYKVDGDAVRFFSKFSFEDKTQIKEDIQEKYIINASILRAVINLREARRAEIKSQGHKLTGIDQTLLNDAISFNKVLLSKHHVEHTLPSSLTRFKAALKRFEMPFMHGGDQYTYNYASLISGKHHNDNRRKVFDHTLHLFQNMFANKQTKPTALEVFQNYDAFLNGYIEVINNRTGEIYNPKEFKKLSQSTVNNYLSQWTSKVATHQLRSDNRQLNMGKFKPFYSFEMPKYSGSIISIDDRQPPFKTLDGKRVWFYLGVDIASQAWTCFVWGDSKEGIILNFYRQMVRNYIMWGYKLPAELECEMSLNSSYTDTFLREGAMFEYVKMEANNARGKYIERMNEELRLRKEKKYEGFLSRPTYRKESNQAGVDIEKVKRLPYDQIIEQCLQEIEDWNNEPHPTDKSVSRWEYFERNQHPELLDINYKGFIRQIGLHTSTSCKLGNVELNNDFALIAEDGRIARGQRLIDLMKVIEGKKIDVYWIDDQMGGVLKAFAYYDDEFVCELMPKPRPNRARKERSADDQEKEQILAAYTTTVDAYARRQMQNIDALTIIDNRPRPERKFKISELDNRRRNAPTEQRETVLMPSVEFDEDFQENYSTHKKSLKDRF